MNIHGDAIHVLAGMPENSVKALITSPPYKKSEGWSRELMGALAHMTERVLQEDGVAMVNFGQVSEDLHRHHKTAIILGRSLRIGPEIAWVKSIPEVGGRFCPLRGNWVLNRKHEYIYIFGKNESVLDRVAEGVGIPYKYKSNTTRFSHGRELQCPGDVWYIPYENKTGKQTRHKYAWPIELPRRLLRLSGVKAGDTVVDPFCGSGVLGKTCAELSPDIKFIGIDSDPKWCL